MDHAWRGGEAVMLEPPDDPDAAAKLARAFGFRSPVLYDRDDTRSVAFKAESLPMPTLILTERGRIISVGGTEILALAERRYAALHN